jgi:hypothetical protein
MRVNERLGMEAEYQICLKASYRAKHRSVKRIHPRDPRNHVPAEIRCAPLVPEGVRENESREYEKKVNEQQSAPIKRREDRPEGLRLERMDVMPADDAKGCDRPKAVEFFESATAGFWVRQVSSHGRRR